MALTLWQTVSGYTNCAERINIDRGNRYIAAFRASFPPLFDGINGAEIAHIGLRRFNNGSVADAVKLTLGAHIIAVFFELC